MLTVIPRGSRGISLHYREGSHDRERSESVGRIACRYKNQGNQDGCPVKENRIILAAVFETVRAGFFGAMDATINLATGFNAVTDYLAIAVGTGRCQHVNRTFETVKGPSFSGRDNLE